MELAAGYGINRSGRHRDRHHRPAGREREHVVSQLELESIALQTIVGLVQQSHTEPAAESQRLLNELLGSLPAAIYTTDADGRITFYNEAAAALWGCRPRLNSDQWSGAWRLYRSDGTHLPHDQCPMAIALKERRPLHGAEAVAERPDGTRVPYIAYPSPLHDHSGTFIGAVNMLVDISERQRAEHLGQRLGAIVESSDDAIVSKNLDGIIETWNQGAEQLFGYAAEEVIGKSITILIPLDRRDEETLIIGRIRRGERVEHYETIRRRKDGSLVEISLTVSPVKDGKGRIIGASKIARDISERKRKEERIELLAREVDHRAKNLLAMVQATVHLTQADTAEALKAAIGGRLRALSNAHDLLAQSRWAGADLQGLVAEELLPYCTDDKPRAVIKGDILMLDPATAQAIAVAVHELTTNAVKYGALSVPSGRLRVEWARSADAGLVLRWVETGGPAVKPPTRRGFGSRIVERMIRDQLKGTAHFDWRKDGLACEITIPVLASAAATSPAAA
jgi:two-component system, chemotaxis family, CheB/CheR fusion protein